MLLEMPKSKVKWFICQFLHHNYGSERPEVLNILTMGRADLGFKSSQHVREGITRKCRRCGQVEGRLSLGGTTWERD